MSISGAAALPTHGTLEAAHFGLTHSAAVAHAQEVASDTNDWQAHFADCGVPAKDIATLADHIDRAFLRDQRKAIFE